MKNAGKQLREKLGLTQREMAEQLNVSRSLYVHYELGARRLPFAAGMRLARLTMKIIDIEIKSNAAKRVHKMVTTRRITEAPKSLIRKLERKLLLQQKKLAAMECDFNALQCELLLARELSAGSTTNGDEKELLGWKIIQSNKERESSQCHEQKQFLLSAKIAGMEVELEVLKGAVPKA